MAVPVVDQFGTFISSIGFDPATTVLALAFAVAFLPGIRRGVLDNRLKSFVENLDYGLVILSTGFLLAFYYEYGLSGVQNELLTITGGFVLGTTVVTFIQKTTGVKQ